MVLELRQKRFQLTKLVRRKEKYFEMDYFFLASVTVVMGIETLRHTKLPVAQ